jgi:membrane protease YdiL (CAAX protease family)
MLGGGLAAYLVVVVAAAVSRRWIPGHAVVATAAALLAAPLIFAPGRWRLRLLRPRPGRLLAGCAEGLAAAAVVLSLFLLVAWWAGRLEPSGLALAELTRRGLSGLLLVALPEEFFFRGYLQRTLALLPGGRVRLLGARCGTGLALAAALFALAHLAVAWDPRALLVFFPGLVFGWLYARRRSVAGPVVFHAACNLSLVWCPTLL